MNDIYINNYNVTAITKRLYPNCHVALIPDHEAVLNVLLTGQLAHAIAVFIEPNADYNSVAMLEITSAWLTAKITMEIMRTDNIYIPVVIYCVEKDQWLPHNYNYLNNMGDDPMWGLPND